MGAEITNAYSNKDLASQLARRIKTNFSSEDLVFQPVHIITPNKAQHQWLKERLAEELGFIANLGQHSLNSFFRQLIDNLDPESKEKRSGKEKLIWKLFSEMGKEDFQNKNEFKKIADYCGADEIKRLALAQKVADLFEKYRDYDPEADWMQKDHPDTDWQKYLYESSGAVGAHTTPSRFKELVEENTGVLEKFHSLYLFGSLQVSPLHLEYLKILKEVEGFQLYVYKTYMGLKVEKNPLAESWGAYLVHASEQLKELGHLPNNSKLPPAKNKLQQFQNDILSDRISDTLAEDNSLLIYNSFTRVREVEALYNYLVKTVDESKEKERLGARDIMVFMPNLDPYISAIRTVFDSAPYKFPYTLVTRGYGREEGFWTALEGVLEFEKENFTAPGVFNLLEMLTIQKSFGFVDLDLLKKAFIDANIRREYEGDIELETNYASFSNGLNRLIYGFCLGSEEPVEVAGKMIYPVDIAEGQQANDLFRLHHLVDLLNKFLETKAERHNAADWHTKLMEIADEFLQPEEWQQQQFRDLMENLADPKTAEDEKIAFRTFYYRLKDQLENKDLQQIKGNRGILFSGLYPGISMPKKVVAFLGMNFEEFPRKSRDLSFDLLDREQFPGSRKEDRGAFLETFLNAEKKVLLSYIGQNVKNNSLIPPSALISELQDYAENAKGKIREVKHLLHSHSSTYFSEEKTDLFTYLITDSRKNKPTEKPPTSFETPIEISLLELERFLKDPFKHHYRKRMDIFYKESEDLPDWELFSLNALEKWKLKKNSLEHALSLEKESLDQRRLELIRNSQLPLKNIGLVNLDKADTEVKNQVQTLGGDNIEEVEVDLNFLIEGYPQICLKGILQKIGNQGLFLTVSKEKRKKYELVAYLHFLVLKATDIADSLLYSCFSKYGNKAKSQVIAPEITKEEAKARIAFYIKLLLKNYQGITAFYPEFNFAVKELKDCGNPAEEKTIENIRRLIDEKFESDNFYPSSYFQTEYYQGFFEGPIGAVNLENIQKSHIEIFEPIEPLFDTKKGKK